MRNIRSPTKRAERRFFNTKFADLIRDLQI